MSLRNSAFLHDETGTGREHFSNTMSEAVSADYQEGKTLEEQDACIIWLILEAKDS
jgi:hypothetical protein